MLIYVLVIDQVSRSDIRGERIEVTSTAEATIEFNLRNSANTANTEVIGSMAEVNRPAAVTLTPTLERNGPPDWTQSAEIPNFNSDTHVPATQTDGVVRPLIPFHYSDDVSDEDARQSVIVPAVAVAPAVNTRSRDQEAANESVIILSDDEEDDEIVCITTKVNPAYRHRRIPRRPPLLLELPDSPPPPPPPAPVVVPTPAPEPTGVIRRCPVCMDTLDEVGRCMTVSIVL